MKYDLIISDIYIYKKKRNLWRNQVFGIPRSTLGKGTDQMIPGIPQNPRLPQVRDCRKHTFQRNFGDMMGDTGRIGTCWGPVGAVPNLVSSVRPQADRKQGLSLRSRYLAGQVNASNSGKAQTGLSPSSPCKAHASKSGEQGKYEVCESQNEVDLEVHTSSTENFDRFGNFTNLADSPHKLKICWKE